jgi:hypothetical protein
MPQTIARGGQDHVDKRAWTHLGMSYKLPECYYMQNLIHQLLSRLLPEGLGIGLSVRMVPISTFHRPDAECRGLGKHHN